MVRIAAWDVVLCSAVRCCSLPTALRLLSVKSERKLPGNNYQDIVTAVDAVLGINQFIFKPICWKRAALLHRFLGLRGFDTTIVFGLRKDAEGELNGHAWLETNGLSILEPEQPNYTVTYRFPSAETCDVDLGSMASD